MNLLSISITSTVVLTALLLAGCDFAREPPEPQKIQEQLAIYRKQEQNMILATVADPDRADRLLALIAERDELIAHASSTINTFRDQMTALNADYHADRASFKTLVASYSSQREVVQRRFVAVIGQMKAVATPDEWRDISRFQTKQLNPRQLVYGTPGKGG